MLQHIVDDFRIIDETDDYIVVDKPAFLLTHPTKPNGAPTLWKQLHQLLAFEIAGGRRKIRNAHARAAAQERISGGCLGLARMANESRRRSFRSTRQTSKIRDLVETDDSPGGCACADRISHRAMFRKDSW